MSIEKEISALALSIRELASEISKLSFDSPKKPEVEAKLVEKEVAPVAPKKAEVIEEKKEEPKLPKFFLAPVEEEKKEEKADCPYTTVAEITKYLIDVYQTRGVSDDKFADKLQAVMIDLGIEGADINNLKPEQIAPLYHAVEAI